MTLGLELLRELKSGALVPRERKKILEPNNQEEIDETTGEILRPLSEVYDAENDLTMYVITPIHSISDVLRFALANCADTEDFQFQVTDVIEQHNRMNID